MMQTLSKPNEAAKMKEIAENRNAPPRYNVISLRISNQELELIRALTGQSKQSTSDFLRDAIALFIAKATGSHGAGFPCQEDA